MKTIAAVVAYNRNRVIGNAGTIPWHYPNDLKSFKELTSGGIVIMGRKTYESLPEKYRPLPDRKTFIITRNPDYQVNHPSVTVFTSPEKLLMYSYLLTDNGVLYVAGGEEIYKAMMPYTTLLYITKIPDNSKGDTHFPEIGLEWYEDCIATWMRNCHYKKNTGLDFSVMRRSHKHCAKISIEDDE